MFFAFVCINLLFNVLFLQSKSITMKMIPIIKCTNMAASVKFYTTILDFQPKCPDPDTNFPVINLVNGDGEIQLSVLGGDSVFGCAVNVRVDEVDDLFDKYINRGLDPSGKADSPVHRGPIDQSWGMREFYVTDPDGNTLRFGKDIG
jgi:catechol 2,3-dioxygenase-like lactoylglutathione lyase family enzyme